MSKTKIQREKPCQDIQKTFLNNSNTQAHSTNRSSAFEQHR